MDGWMRGRKEGGGREEEEGRMRKGGGGIKGGRKREELSKKDWKIRGWIAYLDCRRRPR